MESKKNLLYSTPYSERNVWFTRLISRSGGENGLGEHLIRSAGLVRRHEPQLGLGGHDQLGGLSQSHAAAIQRRLVAARALAAVIPVLPLDAVLRARAPLAHRRPGAVLLVRIVAAVVLPVAPQAGIDALSVAAPELAGRTQAELVARALVLVGAVAAVVVPVADEGERHALVVAAAQAVGRAGQRGAHGAVLVGAVLAVGLPVAAPVLVDAQAVVALEARRARVAAVRLVRTVCAVRVAVAFPLTERNVTLRHCAEFVILKGMSCRIEI